MDNKNSYFKTTYLSDLTYIKGVGPHRAAVLKKHGLQTIQDILYYIPRKFLDRTHIMKINSVRAGDEAVIIGKVIAKGIKKNRKRNSFQVTISDGTGIMTCVWFHSISWITEKFIEGDLVAFFGKVDFYNGLKLVHPDFDLLDSGEDPINTNQIIAQYPSTAELKSMGFDSRGFRRLLRSIFLKLEEFPIDPFVGLNTGDVRLISLPDAIQSIHSPESLEKIKTAMFRLKFEEHFFFQILMALRRCVLREATGRIFDKKGEYVKRIYDRLPFTLTKAQIKVLREIHHDLKSPIQMNRLLQGDVGSGKTIVAMLTAAIIIGHNSQAAVMAPTEILAEQHFTGLKKYCDLVNINIVLLKGGITGDDRLSLLSDIKKGTAQLIIGTHALIQSDVIFKDLALIIVDEQHRFGVDQRKILIDKGYHPEVLAMTATPIPRTLAITYHGDMDVSVIDELPKGRIPIITKVVTPGRLPKVYDFIRKEVEKGRQCFVVYPLIDESEKMDLEAASSGFKKLQKDIFPKLKVGYIHGKMKSDDRDIEMQDFIKNKSNILVSTTVIEVGIDIPNAAIMVIENAERFGLAQLHQLRGRIGRGTEQSYCILVQRKKTEAGLHRLGIMEKTNDGFEIAEEDLKMRGPGEFFGTQQSGYGKSLIVNFQEDGAIIRKARQLAFNIVEKDPHLTGSPHQNIRKKFMQKYKSMLDFVNIG